ncbi:ribonuclease M5 [Mycoplasma putrefaciens]|uniref:Ribonuclease M5 n=1 Tax=Mycoplasma putrefaciens Mput9231 TaxID=1292033 RepID=M9WE97_9MOLU|nr:ribonuclease M5 [Mycoplasma putrefaciens]AGJ91126.1 Primase-related protein [Mycoplasma putrefaciens Mput9231]
MTNKIKQVIVVEGKTDTQKLKQIYGNEIKTIETKGLSLNQKTLDLIKEFNNTVGIIIFTDPDGPGKKIREQIIAYLDNKVLNAFITKQDINKKAKKIGLAQADEHSIKNALSKLVTYDKNNNSISWNEYLENDFYLKANRVKICDHFNFESTISSKTLFKWLNWMNLDVDKIKEILGEANANKS